MAALYKKKGSKHWWVRYKDLETGAWKGKDTGYNTDGSGTVQAKILLRRTEAQEQERKAQLILNKPINANHPWEEWAIGHINERWGGRNTSTLRLCINSYWSLLKYFKEIQITQPAQLNREVVRNYVPWRLKHNGCKNTAIKEINFLAMLLDHAVEEKWIAANPALGSQLKKEDHKPTKPWSDLQVETIRKALDERDPYGWMNTTFKMGLYQGIRKFQSQVPLEGIDFQNRCIIYPGKIMKDGKLVNLVKNGEGYTQIIFRPFIPILQELVSYRKSLGEERLCDIPKPERSSLEWREFLDEFGFTDISHHGLRARFATLAIRNGMHPTKSMLFLNHKSAAVHRQYQALVPQDITSDLDDLADKLGY